MDKLIRYFEFHTFSIYHSYLISHYFKIVYITDLLIINLLTISTDLNKCKPFEEIIELPGLHLELKLFNECIRKEIHTF